MNDTLYLAGPINGRGVSAELWREKVKRLWQGRCLDPLRRDYRGSEGLPGAAAEIVAGDLKDIDDSNAMLVYFDAPSVGTSMEVFYAKAVRKIPVVVLDASGRPLSPWLVHHSDAVCTDFGVALATVHSLLRYGK